MQPEPWMRGTHQEIGVVARAVVHALELAMEEIEKWCVGLSAEQVHARPCGLPPVAFQLRHIAGSVDRILSYAEGRALTEEQLTALRGEDSGEGAPAEVISSTLAALRTAIERVHALDEADLAQPRGIGRMQLPTTVGGALIHVADHTQRHVGQLITTVKVVNQKCKRTEQDLNNADRNG